MQEKAKRETKAKTKKIISSATTKTNSSEELLPLEKKRLVKKNKN